MSHYFPYWFIEFNKYLKKDDITYAFNQDIIYGIINNYLCIDMEQYKKVIFHEITWVLECRRTIRKKIF
jgi:DNA-binding MltR family transcriptional regulator